MPTEYTGPDHLSPQNKRINFLRELLGISEIISDEIVQEHQRRELLKACVATYLERESAEEKKQLEMNNSTFKKDSLPLDQNQQVETKLIADLSHVFSEFTANMNKASTVATAAAIQTATQVLAQHGYQQNSPTAQAARIFVQNAYHIPAVLHAASQAMQPRQTPPDTHTVSLASEHHTLVDTHESLHHHIKQERAALVRILETPVTHHTERFEHEFLDKWARLSSAIAHGKALAHVHRTHPTADHDLLRKVAGEVLTSDSHHNFVQSHREQMKQTFERVKAATTSAHHHRNPVAALHDFFKIYPPTPRPTYRNKNDDTHEYTASSPFKLRPRNPGEVT